MLTRRSKYKAVKINNRFGKFDSKKEYERYLMLLDREKHGEISNLERQVEYILVPRQVDEKGKTLEQAVKYRADFKYVEGGREVVEDVKGIKTRDYIIKRKLMLERYKIRIRET